MKVLRRLFSSRKFVVSLAGILTVIGNDLFSFGLEEDTLVKILGLVGAFVVGQGLADFGKEREVEVLKREFLTQNSRFSNR